MNQETEPTPRADSAAIAFASVVNGLAAYGLVIVVSRAYGDVDFAAFSVAWSIWALGVAVLVFPLQHWIIWRSTVDSGTRGVRSALPRIIGLVAVALLLLALCGMSRRLFPTGDNWAAILVATGATSALLGFGRGLLASSGRYRSVAWVIGGENVVRLAAVALVVLGDGGPELASLALASGVVVLAPFWRRLRLESGAPSPPVHIVAELGALAGATALAQVMVQFPPAFSEWLGDSAAVVSAIFATFSLGRAPLLVLLALTTRLTEPLTRFVNSGEADHGRALRRGFVFVVVSVASAFALGYLVGPQVVRFFFGPGRALGSLETAAVAAGLVMAMAGLIGILILLAEGSSWSASGYWAVAVAVAIALGVGGVPVPYAFLVAEAVALVLTVVKVWALHRARFTRLRE